MPPTSTNAEGQVWVPGHNSWTGGEWKWVDGAWQRPPQSGATWVPGQYDTQNKRWTEGYWNPGGNPATRVQDGAAPKR
jgi:hypothetical protein